MYFAPLYFALSLCAVFIGRVEEEERRCGAEEGLLKEAATAMLTAAKPVSRENYTLEIMSHYFQSGTFVRETDFYFASQN